MYVVYECTVKCFRYFEMLIVIQKSRLIDNHNILQYIIIFRNKINFIIMRLYNIYILFYTDNTSILLCKH